MLYDAPRDIDKVRQAKRDRGKNYRNVTTAPKLQAMMSDHHCPFAALALVDSRQYQASKSSQQHNKRNDNNAEDVR